MFLELLKALRTGTTLFLAYKDIEIMSPTHFSEKTESKVQMKKFDKFQWKKIPRIDVTLQKTWKNNFA